MFSNILNKIIKNINWYDVARHIATPENATRFFTFVQKVKNFNRNSVENTSKKIREINNTSKKIRAIKNKTKVPESAKTPKQKKEIVDPPKQKKEIVDPPKQKKEIVDPPKALTLKEIWSMPNQHKILEKISACVLYFGKFITVIGSIFSFCYLIVHCGINSSGLYILLYLSLVVLVICFFWYFPDLMKRIFYSRITKLKQIITELFSGSLLFLTGTTAISLSALSPQKDGTLLELPGVHILREYTLQEKLTWITKLKDFFQKNGLSNDQINLMFQDIDVRTINTYEHLLSLLIERKNLVLNLLQSSESPSSEKSWLATLGDFVWSHPFYAGLATLTLVLALGFYFYNDPTLLNIVQRQIQLNKEQFETLAQMQALDHEAIVNLGNAVTEISESLKNTQIASHILHSCHKKLWLILKQYFVLMQPQTNQVLVAQFRTTLDLFDHLGRLMGLPEDYITSCDIAKLQQLFVKDSYEAALQVIAP